MSAPHQRYELPTSVGMLTIVPNGLRSAYVTSDGLDPQVKLEATVRGIAYNVSAHLVHEHGEWRTDVYDSGEPRRWHCTRVGTFGDHASDAALKSIKYAVLAGVTAFHHERPDAFVEAERMNLCDDATARAEDVVKARKALADAEAALDAACNRLTEFKKARGL